MSLTNVSKPTTTLSNVAKVAIFETWATILSTWTAESRTWDDCISLIDNSSKVSASITNVSKPA